MTTSTPGGGNPQLFTDGAAHAYEASLGAGERIADSAALSHLITRREHDTTLLSNGTTAKTIGSGGPIHLDSVIVHTALVGTLTIVGFTDEAGAAQSVVLPIGFVGKWEPVDGRILELCTVTKSSASDDGNGRVAINWRPME